LAKFCYRFALPPSHMSIFASSQVLFSPRSLLFSVLSFSSLQFFIFHLPFFYSPFSIHFSNSTFILLLLFYLLCCPYPLLLSFPDYNRLFATLGHADFE
jgi:hypothetical protein